MKRILSCLLLIIPLVSFGQKWVTPFEKAEGNYTGTYNEVIEFYSSLDAAFDEIKMVPFGKTDSGYPLHLVLFDTKKQFDPEKARESGRGILMINNGIHPGEPDGIEASMLYLRDLATSKSKAKSYENILLGIIPIYNIGGALNRNSTTRANQLGPEEYGFRGNAKNRDLNRDFIKMDTRNARAFAEIFHYLNPDVFIDTHVSNGADYQYTITHLASQPDKLGGQLGEYMQKEMIPKLEGHMKSLKAEIIPYVNSFGITPDKGYGIFFDAPRYSTGYTTLFNSLGFMIETHMLKPFDQRVNSTYQFFVSATRILNEDLEEIRDMRANASSNFANSEEYTITWNRNREDSRDITFKGYEGSMVDSPFGGQRLFYDREKPFEKTIPYYDKFDPGITIKVPEAYVIPQGWTDIIDRLKLNGVTMEPIPEDQQFQVEEYRIDKVVYSQSPYEGHFLHRSVSIKSSLNSRNFRKGDYLIPTNQKAIRYIIETLEPEATDSYFKWNFFDAILQQKEHFSSYVFEDVAIKILKDDSELNNKFNEAKEADKELADSRRRQLNWIYRNSPYYENAHMTYPVYRIPKK